MTLDEAIEHAEERVCGNDQCAKDHAQLADWLRELRRARTEIDLLKTLRDGFRADAQMYMAENANLRQLATALEDCRHTTCDDCVRWDYPNGGCYLDDVMRELGIEVPHD